VVVALAQIDAAVGDFAGNRDRIVRLVREARAREPRTSLVVFPETALCGYPPMDLLDQECFVEGSLASLRALQRELPRGVAVAVGYVDRNCSGSGKPLVNAVAVIRDGNVVFTQEKTLLPTYDVFDEARYFEPAKARRVFEFEGLRVGFSVCEDIWWAEPPVPGIHYPLDPRRDLLNQGVDLMVVPSASPFQAGKLDVRIRLAASLAREASVPVLYCNLVGATDSLVFDGRSFVVDASGKPMALAGWEEGLVFSDLDAPAQAVEIPRDRWVETEKALVVGIRGYMRKCGFRTAHVGISGGIDSALVAVLAVEAVGPENVVLVGMPSRFSSEGSVSDSRALADALGVRMEILPIEEPFKAFLEVFKPHFGDRPFDLAEENLQARVRGNILMTWSNKFGSLLLTTGNKSELACGYCTLYGDMCGALAPIGDLFKTEVYSLARAINARWKEEGRVPPIPEPTLTKVPSAELRANQTDQDSLPPYDELDAILDLYIVRNLSAGEIVARGHEGELVRRVISMVARAEYKRRQAAPVLKVSPRAFGVGRRIPIARVIHEAGTA
jgi:NAD+ synthase (glutamine-hydrolysing)